MKKIICVLLAAVMLSGTLPPADFAGISWFDKAVYAEEEQQWEYAVCEDGVELTAYLGEQTDIYVPASITADGTEYNVLKLADGIFKNNTNINSVTLGEGILEIGAGAFEGAASLVCIVTNETLTTIGESAFSGCTAFNSVILYNAVTEIGENAFSGCNSLTIYGSSGSAGEAYAADNNIPFVIISEDATPEIYTSDNITYYIMNGEAVATSYSGTETEIEIPAAVHGYPVTALKATFNDYMKLRNITLPNSLKCIGGDTFNNCQLLTGIEIPDSVKSIEQNAFFACYSLKNVKFPAELLSIDFQAFKYCNKLTAIDLPDSLISIGSYAFANCYGLKSIKFPKGLKNIGSYAFENCSGLTDAEFYEGLTCVDFKAFAGCTKLRTAKIPDSVTKIYNRSFPDTTIWMVNENSYVHTFAVENDILYFINTEEGNEPELYTVDDVTYYIMNGEAKAIAAKTSITVIEIPEAVEGYSVVDIRKVFYAHSSLKSIKIPDSVASIGDYAFYYCTSLESIVIPDGIASIGDYAFEWCTSLEGIEIPDSVTYIGYGAFMHCTALKNVKLSKNLNSIASRMFNSCTSLVNIEIPESVTEIGLNSFSGCTKLQNVTIPNGVKTIGSRAFYDCSKLAEAKIPESVSEMYADSFLSSTILMVQENSYAHTFAEENDLMYFVITEDGGEPEVYVDGGITYYVLAGKAIAVGADKALTQFTIPETIKGYPVTELRGTFKSHTQLESVIIPNSVISLGDHTFYECTGLKELLIPEKVTKIGNNAFGGCTGLESMKIPDSVTDIGRAVFSGCTGLTNIEIPNNIKIIPWWMFNDCRSLTDIKIPEGVTTIEGYAFNGCLSLTDIKIPESVTTIGERAFSSCLSLTEITIPEGVTVIAQNVFSNCYGLKNIELPKSVTAIEWSAFSGCTSLEKIIIPEGVKSIGPSAFYDCDNLKTVQIPKSVTSMDSGSLFPANTILCVEENSYAHTFAVENNMLYFVLRKTENPEISYGSGLSGTVSYTDGTAVSGAAVEIVYDDGTVKEAVTTDESGAYSFTYAEVGVYTIKVTDTGGNTGSEKISVKRMNVFDVFLSGTTDIVLKKGYAVSGTVLPETASVTLADTEGNVIESVETTDGSYTFENVPNGDYVIKIETDNGSAVKEITVFGGDVTVEETVIEENTETASIKGYVEVEGRDEQHYRRNWIHITLYNADGVAVDTQKSDGDGAYCFGNLPFGEYSIVAETAEMRPDKKCGYDRSYTLTGYAYVNVTEAKTYEADTIVLYEENDNLAEISGRVTAYGENQQGEVILRNVFRHEVAKVTTGNNGKYAFKNVCDGLYFITAVTESNGMGFTVVVVRHGKVYGNTNITVFKSDKIKDHEERMKNDIPQCGGREDALRYKDRIAEEKRFYDGLSEKEKEQCSREYIERINRLSEWISDCGYTISGNGVGDGCRVENGGMIMSGDEISREETVELVVNIEKREPHRKSEGGVRNGDDLIQHSIEDTAGNRELKQYYDITLTKNGKVVSSVQRDTETTGKLRITMPIPDEYKGHKHYSFIHVHNGEITVLTDLDDDPDTITFEIDRFSTFALCCTDEELAEAIATVYGDVNGDGSVNTLDRAVLSRYLSHWSNYTDGIDTDAADVNGDGAVNTLDRAIFSRYLSNWNGYNALPYGD